MNELEAKKAEIERLEKELEKLSKPSLVRIKGIGVKVVETLKIGESRTVYQPKSIRKFKRQPRMEYIKSIPIICVVEEV